MNAILNRKSGEQYVGPIRASDRLILMSLRKGEIKPDLQPVKILKCAWRNKRNDGSPQGSSWRAKLKRLFSYPSTAALWIKKKRLNARPMLSAHISMFRVLLNRTDFIHLQLVHNVFTRKGHPNILNSKCREIP